MKTKAVWMFRIFWILIILTIFCPQVEAKRVPRRVLHFSDGVIEEFSTDDEAEREEEEKRQREANQQVKCSSL